MSRRDLAAWVAEAVALQEQDAQAAGAVGYMGRIFVQTTLPHTARPETEYERSNGRLHLSLLARKRVGLPYGVYPRLVLSWLTTEAVRTKNRELVLGDSLAAWLRQLGLPRTGGSRGTIHRLHDQMRRLFTCMISVEEERDGGWVEAGMRVASRSMLWWDPKSPEAQGLWESTVTLSPDFYACVTDRPPPIDLRALQALKGSPLRLDLYCWLTWRMSTLPGPRTVPWDALALQFGGDYAQPRQFKAAALKHLPYVLAVYPEAKVEATNGGLLLRPSPPHVPPRAARLLPASI